MIINRLKLKNFRNYDSLDITFNNKLNIIIGNNAQGKTNILEAIYFLSITKSNLAMNDKSCIKKDKLSSKLEASIEDKIGEKNISIVLNNIGKKLTVNSNEIKKHSEYIGNLKVVIFNPDDVRLIKEAPGNRRKFLNIEISQLYNSYINILNEYNVILKQRNEYLKIIKNKPINNLYLDIVNNKLADLAESIYKYRIDFINEINKYIGDIYFNIAGNEGLKLKYLPNIDISDDIKKDLLNKLENNLEKEILYGNTLYGPHRDDFLLVLNDSDLITYGSQGQQKMSILALKLAEINVFYNICDDYPVVLLDDLFSELDIIKRNKVITYLKDNVQAIITTTDLKNINKRLIKNATVFTVENGKIVY